MKEKYHCALCGEWTSMRPGVPLSILFCKRCLDKKSIGYPAYNLLKNYRLNMRLYRNRNKKQNPKGNEVSGK